MRSSGWTFEIGGFFRLESKLYYSYEFYNSLHVAIPLSLQLLLAHFMVLCTTFLLLLRTPDWYFCRWYWGTNKMIRLFRAKSHGIWLHGFCDKDKRQCAGICPEKRTTWMVRKIRKNIPFWRFVNKLRACPTSDLFAWICTKHAWMHWVAHSETFVHLSRENNCCCGRELLAVLKKVWLCPQKSYLVYWLDSCHSHLTIHGVVVYTFLHAM